LALLNDCANLRWRHIHLLSKVKKIAFEVAKTGDEIEVPIHPALEDYLLTLKPKSKSQDEFLFPSLAGRVVSNLSKQFARLMDDAHIGNRDIRKRGDGAARRARVTLCRPQAAATVKTAHLRNHVCHLRSSHASRCSCHVERSRDISGPDL